MLGACQETGNRQRRSAMVQAFRLTTGPYVNPGGFGVKVLAISTPQSMPNQLRIVCREGRSGWVTISGSGA